MGLSCSVLPMGDSRPPPTIELPSEVIQLMRKQQEPVAPVPMMVPGPMMFPPRYPACFCNHQPYLTGMFGCNCAAPQGYGPGPWMDHNNHPSKTKEQQVREITDLAKRSPWLAERLYKMTMKDDRSKKEELDHKSESGSEEIPYRVIVTNESRIDSCPEPIPPPVSEVVTLAHRSNLLPEPKTTKKIAPNCSRAVSSGEHYYLKEKTVGSGAVAQQYTKSVRSDMKKLSENKSQPDEIEEFGKGTASACFVLATRREEDDTMSVMFNARRVTIPTTTMDDAKKKTKEAVDAAIKLTLEETSSHAKMEGKLREIKTDDVKAIRTDAAGQISKEIAKEEIKHSKQLSKDAEGEAKAGEELSKEVKENAKMKEMTGKAPSKPITMNVSLASLPTLASKYHMLLEIAKHKGGVFSPPKATTILPPSTFLSRFDQLKEHSAVALSKIKPRSRSPPPSKPFISCVSSALAQESEFSIAVLAPPSDLSVKSKSEIPTECKSEGSGQSGKFTIMKHGSKSKSDSWPL